MKIYLATSWKNEQQPEVLRQLHEGGHEVYDFRNPRPGDQGFAWSEIDPDWESWSAYEQIEALTHPAAERGLRNDFDAMRWCDALIMLQPCGRSAALELGWAVGAGKRTIVIMAEGQQPELMIRLADRLVCDVSEAMMELDGWERS